MTAATPRALLDHPDYLRFQASRFVATLGMQSTSVAVAWQVYELTHRKIDLGYVGLSQFVPGLCLALVTGAVADRIDRRAIITACHVLIAACYVALWALAHAHVPSPLPIYAVLFAFGTARAFLGPASQALLPTTVPTALFPTAMALSSTVWQVGTVVGPALGGVLYAALGPWVYLLSAAFACTAALLARALTARSATTPAKPRPGRAELLAGVRYVWSNPLVLGATTLDLFAVLLGGAVALLPVYARDILHAGPLGLGLLRASPAVGGALTALRLAYRPLGARAGRTLFLSVAAFGAATVVFGVSRSIALSAVALAVTGAADMVSVVVRQHVVQLATPDAMRGRVSAVNLVFISTSNELGEFESGVTAEWFGPKAAVVFGGVGTLLVVAAWTRLFPALHAVDRLDALRPKEPAA